MMTMKYSTLIFCLLCSTAIASKRDTIYIYADNGVSPESLTQTLHTTTALLGKQYHVTTLNADAVIHGNWRNHAALFIMPGGADIPYDKALHGQGNQHIKAFVTEGGAYLGICAGGYYGSQTVLFAPGTPLEVKGTRELAFYPNTASGPALAPYDYKSNKGARAARLLLPNSRFATVYYNGGGQFSANPMPKKSTVIARYRDLPQQPPAIIMMKVGKGVAILSGVHFEYDHNLLNSDDRYLATIIPNLKQHELERQQLLKSIFNRLQLI
ncbi:MAG: BPL-N domain-containing protein [Pseudomonadota bacterium]|nr:BPL-N domain-containing protein [Pseudomonadota bacterium]